MDDKIVFDPIGFISTNFKEKSGVPIQFAYSDALGTVMVYQAYREGLKDLEGFSHIYLFYHLNQHHDYTLTTTPYLDDTPRGIFATRAPKRPNGLGMSIAEIVSVDIEDGSVVFTGADMLDGTPLIDIKPYVDEFDTVESTRHGWYEKVSKDRSRVSDNRF